MPHMAFILMYAMVPFRNNGHLTNLQENFNYCLSSARLAVERIIGSLKERFRILLDCLPLTDVKKIPEFIVACCVLHNICVLQNDEIPIGIQLRHVEEIDHIIHNNNATELGKAKRTLIMNALRMRIAY
ncbi:PREDICTED: uncharacterized protein LOC105450363 [Wasmannia auropunctata]|uniref:uncharacterized protein LOC105450363 n=1 Tax=Wasmannia auropunctata TaxID=64793 RepID=UPI0005F07363|nr:PREDICTED: uncharacterized protein LOC105450363 [Wasmannia auropunctata]